MTAGSGTAGPQNARVRTETIRPFLKYAIIISSPPSPPSPSSPSSPHRCTTNARHRPSPPRRLPDSSKRLPISAQARTLLLITASSPDIQRVRRNRVLNFQQITMPYLAAFVPPHWTVLHVDEATEPVDPNQPADLVAITFRTPSAQHAYDLAACFRQRGITVALGGPHVTLAPDEAQEHADVIFISTTTSTRNFSRSTSSTRLTMVPAASLESAKRCATTTASLSSCR